MVRIPAFHAGGPGSIPGVGAIIFFLFPHEHMILFASDDFIFGDILFFGCLMMVCS